MNEFLFCAETLPEAYHDSLCALHKFGTESPVPDYSTKQKEISVTMQILHPLQEPMISRLSFGGPRELEQYRQEMLDGILDFEVQRGNWAYTYHQRMEKQLPFIIRELRRNKDSRRAVIDVRDWLTDSESADPACLQHIQYFIRDNALHCKVLFRSNDACKAAFMNMFALIMLQKRVADELGVEMGTYTHRANSYHVYKRDYALLDEYAKRINSHAPNTYNYIGEWDSYMEACKADIAKTVAKLKGGV